MNIYLLMSRFWRDTEGAGVSTTEAALFFYLLYLANVNRWKMPFACSTAVLAQRLHTTKQSIIRARESLTVRGVIDFISGKGKDEYPQYAITLNVADELSDNLSGGLSGELSDKLSDGLTLSNIKDKDKNISSQNAHEEKLIADLERLFVADTDWHQSLITAISSPTIRSSSDVISFIHRFFNSQRAGAVKEREEKDCRKHFYNWLRIQVKNLKSNTNGTNKHSDPRRGVEAQPRSEENTGRPF